MKFFFKIYTKCLDRFNFSAIYFIIFLSVSIYSNYSFANFECIKGNCFNGQGTQTHLSGYEYIGDFKNGLRNGTGTETLQNGQIYTGKFKNDVRHGHGSLTYPNGSIYIGEFKDDYEHGQGTLITSDGTSYFVQYMNGKIHSKKKDIQLIEKKIDNLSLLSDLDNEIQKKQKITNYQCLIGDCINGEGEVHYQDGYKYKGEFMNGIPNGRGIEILPNGNKYTGEFEDGRRFYDIYVYKNIIKKKYTEQIFNNFLWEDITDLKGKPDSLSDFGYQINKNYWSLGEKFPFSLSNKSTLLKIIFNNEKTFEDYYALGSEKLVTNKKFITTFSFIAEYEENIKMEINIEYIKKNKNFENAKVLAEYYAHMYGQMPKVLRLLNKKIIVLEENNNRSWYVLDDAKAQFYIRDNLCKKNANKSKINPNDDKIKFMYFYCSSRMMHELTHIFDQFGVKFFSKKKWLEARKLDGEKFCTLYSFTSKKEDFADSFTCWFLLRYKLNYLSVIEFKKINYLMAHKIEYLDSLNLDMYPY